MPRIMNMCGFQICQVSQYNEHEIRLALEQAPRNFEWNFLFAIPFKTKINLTLF